MLFFKNCGSAKLRVYPIKTETHPQHFHKLIATSQQRNNNAITPFGMISTATNQPRNSSITSYYESHVILVTAF